MANDASQNTHARKPPRQYDPAFKRALVEQSTLPGMSVASIAREHGINANQLFKWRRQLLPEAPTPVPADPASHAISLLPVTITDEQSAPAPPPPGRIEIALAGGTVQICGTVDPTVLQLVLSSLRR